MEGEAIMITPVEWLSDNEFKIGNIIFFCDTADYTPDQSTDSRFHILKGKSFFDLYDGLFANHSIHNMVELGIFDGGSTMYFLKRFNIRKLFALDVRHRLEYLEAAISSNTLGDRVYMKYATSQDDASAAETSDFYFEEDAIDLVIDDASHLYDLSKRSFELYFPRLRSGGIYVLEDWGWAHNAATQPGGPLYEVFKDHRSLSHLLFKLQMVMISRPDLIGSIHVTGSYAIITKGSAAPTKTLLDLETMALNRSETLFDVNTAGA